MLSQIEKFEMLNKRSNIEVKNFIDISLDPSNNFSNDKSIREIFSSIEITDGNWTRTKNHLVRKRTLNHLARWLSVRLQIKWFWVRV